MAVSVRMQNDESRSPAVSRENLTLVFTDIQGYSELTARLSGEFSPGSGAP